MTATASARVPWDERRRTVHADWQLHGVCRGALRAKFSSRRGNSENKSTEADLARRAADSSLSKNLTGHAIRPRNTRAHPTYRSRPCDRINAIYLPHGQSSENDTD